MSRSVTTSPALHFIAGLLCLLSGCGQPQPINSKIINPDDQLTTGDVKLFLEIAEHLPDGALKDVPAPYQPAPKWDSARTLPVNELARNELHQLNLRWKYDAFVKALPNNKEFARVLKHKHISRERFASLAFALAVAFSKSSMASDFNLDAHHKKSAVVLNDIKHDGRPFHTLSPDVAHEVQRKAAWITEYHRCERLAEIPQLNTKTIQGARKKLSELLHPSFSQSPFNTRLDRNLDVAMPFEDLPGNEKLELLEWSPANAIVGRDDLEQPTTINKN